MDETRRVAPRAADARRADQPGRDERAQRPLLHDQGAGAAADPARPLGLLHPRPRRAARAGAGAAEPRLHAGRDREVRRPHPARRHPGGHRPAAHDARAVAGRGAGRDVPRRARPARRPHARPTTTSTRSRRLGIVLRTKRGRYQVAVSQLSVGLGLLDLGFPTEAALAAADVYAAHGRQIAQELYELFRTKVWPVYKESGASPGAGARGRRAAQAAVDREPGGGLRGGHGRDQARGHRPAGAEAHATRAAVDATPSQVCGLPSQHQPSFGARSLIHSAGTRRSWRREPESMKHLFLSRSAGAWVTTRDALVDGQRRPAPPADHRQRLLGPDAAELLAPLDAEQQVGPGVGHAQVRRAGGSRPGRPRRGCGRPARASCRPPACSSGTVSSGRTRSRVTTRTSGASRPVGLEASPVDLVETLVQRLDELAEGGLVEAGERGVAELDEPVGLVTEGLGSVVRQGHLLRVAVGGQRTAGAGSSLRRREFPKVGA